MNIIFNICKPLHLGGFNQRGDITDLVEKKRYVQLLILI